MKNIKTSDYSSIIRMERLKRSWTQEKLAEHSSLSVRTIQRIENGTEPSMETIRILADCLELDLETIRQERSRSHYGAPWSRALILSSVSFTALLLLTSFLVPSPYSLLPVLLLVLVLFFSVRGYSIMKGKLYVHRLGWSNSFALSDLVNLQIDPHLMNGSIRVFGIGGLFGTIGLFKNSIIGLYRAYVTDSGNAVMLQFKGQKSIVISPDDPENFKRAIENTLKESSEPSSLES